MRNAVYSSQRIGLGYNFATERTCNIPPRFFMLFGYIRAKTNLKRLTSFELEGVRQQLFWF
jgi:hypothetical protein